MEPGRSPTRQERSRGGGVPDRVAPGAAARPSRDRAVSPRRRAGGSVPRLLRLLREVLPGHLARGASRVLGLRSGCESLARYHLRRRLLGQSCSVIRSAGGTLLPVLVLLPIVAV